VIANPMDHWALLVKAALVGTDRFQPPEALPAIAGDIAMAESDSATRLLAQASILSPIVRAGQDAAVSTSATVAPAPKDPLREPGPIATHALVQLLAEHPGLLVEWCAAAAGRYRIPDHVLPSYLDHLAGEKAPDIRRAMSALVGPRAAWLAAQNPAWQPITATADPTESWRTGTKAQRIEALIQSRSADPAAGRSMLQQTAAQEAPEDLADFVLVLFQGLSMDDHDFLEALLDAKHKAVRVAAADLLATLPQSARSERNAARVARALAFQKTTKLLRKATTTLTVTLPDSQEATEQKALARDGIELNKKRANMGPKAMTLAQIVSGTPLSWFTATWSATPAEILDAALTGEWAEALYDGFTGAAKLQRDREWTKALLERFAGPAHKFVSSIDVAGLFQALPFADQEAFIASTLGKDPSAVHSQLSLALMNGMTRPWSASFTNAMLKVLKPQFLGQNHWGLRTLITRMSHYFDPSIVDDVADGWPDTSPAWNDGDRQMLATLTSTLALRRNYLKELSA
jgi:uncharacterized protein DUF5691